MQTNNIGSQIKNFIKSPSILNRLIVINIGVFLLVNMLNLIYKLGNIQPTSIISGTYLNELIYFLALPADLHSLAAHPWTIFTYMFLHEQLFHIFFNLFMLFVGGQLFIYFFNEKKLLSVYIFGGIMGAVFYILAFNTIPEFILLKNRSIALGASASVYAVFFALVAHAPNYSVNLFLIGKVKLKYVAIIFVIIDIMLNYGQNIPGIIAHFGGALWGFIFVMNNRKNSKSFFQVDLSKIKAWFKPKKRKLRVDYSEKPNRPLSDEEYNKIKAEKQKRMDAILDKISKSGYSSLSAEEKEFMFKISKNN